MTEDRETPLARDDILRMIEENSGTANGLDLTGPIPGIHQAQRIKIPHEWFQTRQIRTTGLTTCLRTGV